jgi:predicted nucleotidyltransferase
MERAKSKDTQQVKSEGTNTAASNLETVIELLRNYAGAKPEIKALYVFGSSLAKERPGDLDIGLLIAPEGDGKKHPYGYAATVTGELMHLLHRNDIDIVLFHQASPLLCMEAIGKGRLVYGDPGFDQFQFRRRVKDRYLDTAPLRRIKEYYLKRRYLG